MQIILIGYRGSGKSSVGRLLAERMDLDFFDVDDQTRARFGGRTVTDIWSHEGEAAWRETEVEVTRELCRLPRVVIALGGGTLMQPGARTAVEDAPLGEAVGAPAVRLYLMCDPAELSRRIAADVAGAAERPALTSGGDPAEEVRRVLAVREPVYRAVADIVIDVTHLGVEEAAESIEGRVRVPSTALLPSPSNRLGAKK